MVIVILILAVLLVLVFWLRGVGGSYGNGANYTFKNKVKIIDRNYFL